MNTRVCLKYFVNDCSCTTSLNYPLWGTFIYVKINQCMESVPKKLENRLRNAWNLYQKT